MRRESVTKSPAWGAVVVLLKNGWMLEAMTSRVGHSRSACSDRMWIGSVVVMGPGKPAFRRVVLAFVRNCARAWALQYSLKMASLPMTIISTSSHSPAAQEVISLIWACPSARPFSEIKIPSTSLRLWDFAADPTCWRPEQSGL